MIKVTKVLKHSFSTTASSNPNEAAAKLTVLTHSVSTSDRH